MVPLFFISFCTSYPHTDHRPFFLSSYSRYVRSFSFPPSGFLRDFLGDLAFLLFAPSPPLPVLLESPPFHLLRDALFSPWSPRHIHVVFITMAGSRYSHRRYFPWSAHSLRCLLAAFSSSLSAPSSCPSETPQSFSG